MEDLSICIKNLVEKNCYEKRTFSNGVISDKQKEDAKREYDNVVNSIKRPNFNNRFGWEAHLPRWIPTVWDRLDEGVKILLYLTAERACCMAQPDPDVWGY